LVRSLARDKVVREEIKVQSNGDLKRTRKLNKKAFKYAMRSVQILIIQL